MKLDQLKVTVTVNADAADVLPALSVDVQRTTVAPGANTEPELCVQLTGRDPSTRSLADVANVTTRPAAVLPMTAMSAGTVTTGAVVSRTSTVNDALPTFPCPSSAEQSTWVAPIGKTEPDAG